MKSLWLAVCAVGLCLVAWWVVSVGGGAPVVGVEASGPCGATPALAPELSAPTARPEGGRLGEPGRAVPLGLGKSVLEEPPPESREERGFVVGQVADQAGRPLRRQVQFHGPLGEAGIEWTRSDAGGGYRIGLRPGTYRVFHEGAERGKRRESDPAAVCAGVVEVVAGREVLFDLVLTGTRSLRGGIAHAEHDGLLLEVELLLAEDHERVVAKAMAMTDREELAEYQRYLDREGDGDGVKHVRRAPPGVGYFEMEGVPAGLYELRAYLDVDRRFYVRGEVDLRFGDVGFGLVELTSEAFFEHRVLVFE